MHDPSGVEVSNGIPLPTNSTDTAKIKPGQADSDSDASTVPTASVVDFSSDDVG